MASVTPLEHTAIGALAGVVEVSIMQACGRWDHPAPLPPSAAAGGWLATCASLDAPAP